MRSPACSKEGYRTDAAKPKVLTKEKESLS